MSNIPGRIMSFKDLNPFRKPRSRLPSSPSRTSASGTPCPTPDSSTTTKRCPSQGHPPCPTPATTDERYSALREFDTIFLIDDSGSMSGSNWEQTAVALSEVVPVCVNHDSDGVDIYFLNNEESRERVKSPEEVINIFKNAKPFGPTPTGKRLGEILERYLSDYRKNKNIKPLNIIVITDGEPTDPSKLLDNIVNCARELDALQAKDRQIGIQFFQVGCDQDAMDALKELDDELEKTYGIRDMVDTVPWRGMEEGKVLTSEEILKTVLGAVDRILD